MRHRLAALLLCVACASDPVASPSHSPSASPSSSPAPVATGSLADGKHPGLLKSLDTTTLTLVVDVVQFLTGEAARQAAKEDGKEAFDYYVRNQDTSPRTLPVAPDVAVSVTTLRESSDDQPITLAELTGYVDEGRARQVLFNLTVSGGVVTEIREQYLP